PNTIASRRRDHSPRTYRTIASAMSGSRKPPVRLRCACCCCARTKLEKPNRYPPTSEAQTERVRTKQSQYAVQAARAGSRRAARLKEAIGPASSVTGAKARVSVGTDDVQSRLTPFCA